MRPSRVSSSWSRPWCVGVAEAGDPFGGGGERDAVAGLAGPDPETGREVGLAGAGRPEEHDVVLGLDEVEGAEMGDHVAFEGALVVEVEVLEGLAGREPGGPDPDLAAVVLAGRDLALEAGGEELLVGPVLGAGPFGRAGRPTRPATVLSTPGTDRRCRWSASAAVRGHHATPVARS